MKYVLDTNILSEPTRRQPHAGVMAALERHEKTLCTAAPVVHEMIYGIERMEPGPRRDKLSAYANRLLAVPIPVLPYNSEAAQWHGRERARLEKLGQTAPFVDGQIAAVAIVHGCVLVTRNVRQFEVFGDLRLENWFADEPAAAPK